MAIDPRAKGRRAEYDIRDLLRKHTGVEWERVPGSGSYGNSHGLKGDVYLPPSTGKMASFTVEVKHYKDEAFTSNILKDSLGNFGKWMQQTIRESEEMNAKPLLVFKHDRSAWKAALRLVDFKEFAHKIKAPYITLHKDGEVVVILHFSEILENAQEHIYR